MKRRMAKEMEKLKRTDIRVDSNISHVEGESNKHEKDRKDSKVMV